MVTETPMAVRSRRTSCAARSQSAYPFALVIVMVLRRRGLVSGRTPTVALGKRREISAELVAQGRG